MNEQTKRNTSGDEKEDFSKLKNPCCLIAEDSPTIQKYYATLLPTIDVSCTLASDGNEALLKLKEIEKANIKLNFMIVDIMMPGMDGAELMKRLRDMPSFSSTPIMIVSSISDKETAIKLVKDFQPHNYMIKPLETDRLLSAVKEILTLTK